MAARTRTSTTTTTRTTRATKRTRLSPEASRDRILAAADVLFAKHGPDGVGLKEVSRAAGVSHGLVSHYFGTYDGLVEAALDRRIDVIRKQVLLLLSDPEEADRPGAIYYRMATAASDPTTVRLFAWALLTGRLQSPDLFPVRVKGLKVLTDAIEKNLPVRGPEPPTRGDVEFAVMTTVSMTCGWAIGKAAMLSALGRDESDAADQEFRERMAEMLRLYLARPR